MRYIIIALLSFGVSANEYEEIINNQDAQVQKVAIAAKGLCAPYDEQYKEMCRQIAYETVMSAYKSGIVRGKAEVMVKK